MTARDLITDLNNRGVRLWLEPDGTPRLHPSEGLTPEDWQHLKAQRAAVIELLRGEMDHEVVVLKGGRRAVVYFRSKAEKARAVRDARLDLF